MISGNCGGVSPIYSRIRVRCTGKGRKERCTPLDKPAVTVLRDWLTERAGQPADVLFPARRGTAMSRDTFQARLTKYKTIAAETCPSLAARKLAPHVLRHSTAMALRRAGVDISVIALWLGHENISSTQIYIKARVLHQAGEIREVCPGNQRAHRQGAAQFHSPVTWYYAPSSSSNARFARQPGKIIRTDGPPRPRSARPEPGRARGASLRVRRPDGLEEHQRGDGSRLAGADQLRAFRQF